MVICICQFWKKHDVYFDVGACIATRHARVPSVGHRNWIITHMWSISIERVKHVAHLSSQPYQLVRNTCFWQRKKNLIYFSKRDDPFIITHVVKDALPEIATRADGT